MAIKKCPKCGSEKTQLTNIKGKHGILWLILFGWIWLIWVGIKYMIGFTILLCWDWWMAIVKKSSKKGYIYKSKHWFEFSTKMYYCTDCGNNFKG